MVITLEQIKEILDKAETYCRVSDNPANETLYAKGVREGVHLMNLRLVNEFSEFQEIQNTAMEGKDDP